MKWIVATAVYCMIVMSLQKSTVIEAKLCSNGGVWRPSPGTLWLWQIGSIPSTSVIDSSNAQVFDLDVFGVSTTMVDYIHSKGKAIICYIDTAYEPGRPDSSSFTASVKGSALDGWPGQYWVDIRSSVVRNIMAGRVQIAASKGCDAVEWDDVDAYANTNGFGLTYADQIDFNKYLAQITHDAGMSVGLKNDLDQVHDLVNYFDWALNEQCYQYSECSVLSEFISQGKAVFGTEYQGNAATFCPKQNALKFSWLKSNLDLSSQNGVVECCSYSSSGCTPSPYSCVNSTYIGSPTSSSPTATAKPTSAPTSRPTASPTATAKPTSTPTAKPTSAPTAKPTSAPTAKPTTAPTAAAPTATAKPTSAPSTTKPTAAAPTVVPTEKPTKAPATAKPTRKPTTPATIKPTEAADESESSSCSSSSDEDDDDNHHHHHHYDRDEDNNKADTRVVVEEEEEEVQMQNLKYANSAVHTHQHLLICAMLLVVFVFFFG